MKVVKPYVIAVATGVTILGGGLAVAQYVPRYDSSNVVANATTESEEPMKETDDTQPIVSETPADEPITSPAPLPASEPVSPAPSVSREDMWGRVFTIVNERVTGVTGYAHRATQITTAIMSKFETKPELFADGALDTTISRCFDYLKTLPDLTTVQDSLVRQDCGL